MKNLYQLQYQILIFALVSFYSFYTLAELPYLVDIYSAHHGFNTNDTFQGILFPVFNYLSMHTTALNLGFALRLPITFMILYKPLRKPAFVLLICHILFFGQMEHTSSPEMVFLVFLFLMLLAIPEKNFFLFKSFKKTFWSYPRQHQFLVWLVAATAYSVSGYYKYLTPNWFHGYMIEHLLRDLHLARIDYTYLISFKFVKYLCFISTYLAMTIELLALPMVFHPLTRKLSFILLTSMHLIILLSVDITQVSLGMLIFHIYLFEPSLWKTPFSFKRPWDFLRIHK